jgi:hypothetical protein
MNVLPVDVEESTPQYAMPTSVALRESSVNEIRVATARCWPVGPAAEHDLLPLPEPRLSDRQPLQGHEHDDPQDGGYQHPHHDPLCGPQIVALNN